MAILLFILLSANMICMALFFLLLVNYKFIERELQEKKRDIEHLNNARMKHLTQLSHDLRTPLNVIMGYTSLLLNKVHGEINSKQTEDISRIKENSAKILKILEDFFKQNP